MLSPFPMVGVVSMPKGERTRGGESVGFFNVQLTRAINVIVSMIIR